MIKEKIHQNICDHIDDVRAWYKERASDIQVPFYSSFDIRDSGQKIATVDANIFPAGFNNICTVDKESAPGVIQSYAKLDGVKKIAFLTESHTSNLYYWDNVATISSLLREAGFEVMVAIPIDDFGEQTIESASGQKVEVVAANRLADFAPDIVISNNDLTEDVSIPGFHYNPPKEYGWYNRRKHTYFEHYNELVKEFAEVIKVDPEHFIIHTGHFDGFDLGSDESKKDLGAKVDEFIESLKSGYEKNGIDEEPFVFLKNASGTYGLGVLPVKSGEDVVSMSYKQRKKMKAAKGGGGFDEVIVQEGIPSSVTFEEGFAEPVVYMIGTELVGGFLRTHQKKGAKDSLNSPGAVYERMCVSDLKINMADCPHENVYGWLAKIGALAIGREGQSLNVNW